MASIDDVGIDVDLGFEDEAAKNNSGVEVKPEETKMPSDKEESFHKPTPPEISPIENTMQPAESDSSSDEEVDLKSPVGGSNMAGKEDDDDEFDFVITKKETPEIIVEACDEKPVDINSESLVSDEKPCPSAVGNSQQDSAVDHDSSQVNESVDRGGDSSFPIQWKSAQEDSSEVNEDASDGKQEDNSFPIQWKSAQEDSSQVNEDASGTQQENSSFPIQWKSAQKEWDNVRDIQLGSDDDGDDDEEEGVASSNTPIISSQEALGFLKNSENVLAMYRGQIVTSVQRSGFQAFVHALFGPPRIKRHLIPDRDLIFSMALHPYSSSNETHFRMLLSVYKSLTGNNLDCPKFGGHWDAIGFQGDDPGTDFRGTGMLGLLCFLHLTCPKAEVGVSGDVGHDERTRLRQQLSLSLHRLSHDAEQNFPFAIMSINWTRLLLQTLREGCLNKTLNGSCAAKGVHLGDAFLDLHSALAFRFLAVWQREHKTILHSGMVLRDLEEMLRKDASGLLKAWFAHLAGQSSGKPAGPRNKQHGDRYAVEGDGVAQISTLN